MFEKVVAFGCSNTFGKGLPDCIDMDTQLAEEVPSEFAYPSLLGKELSVDVDNRAVVGGSNLIILDSIQNYNFSDNTFVIVQWTSIYRYTRFFIEDDEFKTDNAGLWKIDVPWVKYYFKHFSFLHMLLETYRCISHAELLLKSKKIPYYFFSYVDFLDDKNNTIVKEKPVDWFTTDVHLLIDLLVDKALDNKHPGLQSHKLTCDFLKQILLKELHEQN